MSLDSTCSQKSRTPRRQSKSWSLRRILLPLARSADFPNSLSRKASLQVCRLMLTVEADCLAQSASRRLQINKSFLSRVEWKVKIVTGMKEFSKLAIAPAWQPASSSTRRRAHARSRSSRSHRPTRPTPQFQRLCLKSFRRTFTKTGGRRRL